MEKGGRQTVKFSCSLGLIYKVNMKMKNETKAVTASLDVRVISKNGRADREVKMNELF